MKFDWDADKAKANLDKHGISFEEACGVFYDPFAITVDDMEHSVAEVRKKTVGLSVRLRVLIVVHTDKIDDNIRIISARKASRQEVTDYEEEVKERLSRGK